MKIDIALDPMDIGFFCWVGQMVFAHMVAQLIEKALGLGGQAVSDIVHLAAPQYTVYIYSI